jgi:hypothetical protein
MLTRKVRLLTVLIAAGVLLLAPATARAAGYVYADQWPVLGSNCTAGVHVDGHGGVFVAMANSADPCGVRKYTTDGTLLFGFGTYGSAAGQFTQPWDVELAPNHDIYVSDMSTSYVSVFDESGRYKTRFGGPGAGDGQLTMASGLALDSTGVLYVGDNGNSRVEAFNLAGTWQRTIGSPGTGDGQFRNTWSVAVDALDRLYVADLNDGRIVVFDSYAHGNGYLGQFSVDGTGSGGTHYASWVAVAPNDHVFVGQHTGPTGATLQEFTFNGASGAYVRTIDKGYGTGDGQFGTRVYGIDFNARGDLFAGDGFAQRVQKFAWDDSAPILTHDYDGEWHSQPFTVHFTAKDDYTAVPWLRWTDPGDPWTNDGSVLVPANATTHAYDGYFRPEIGAGDSVSNWAYKTLAIKIDTRPPISHVSGVPAGWTSQTVNVNIDATDVGSGVHRTFYDLDGNGVTELDASGIVTIDTAGPHTLQYFSQDNCADTPNEEATKSVQVLIDQVGPSAIPVNNVNVKHGASATFKYTLNDDFSATCTVKLVIKKKTKIVKSVTLGVKDSNLQVPPHAYGKKLAVALPAGAYTWTVIATDLAKNMGSWAPKKLTVK